MKYTDQIGHVVHLEEIPKRIISLVPSQTELLFDLGLDSEVIGITKFCVHPTGWTRKKNIVGGTKTLHLDKIRSLQPDLIIANKEENDREQIQTLSDEFHVWTSDVRDLPQALEMIRQIGLITGKGNRADEIVRGIEHLFSNSTERSNRKRCVYLIWNEPMMTVNGDTFIHDMLWRYGLQNCFSHLDSSRYPAIRDEELIAAQPEILMLSSEPFPFKEKHIQHFRSLLPDTKVVLVDGEIWSWYGSRLLKNDPTQFAYLLT